MSDTPDPARPGPVPGTAALHRTVADRFMRTGRAPDAETLCASLGCTAQALREGLRRLAEAHGAVLEADGDRIRAVHPFSAVPTDFTVRRGAGAWWGNCAWCALGIAALLPGPATVATTVGRADGGGRPALLHVDRTRVAEGGLVVHFPVPMRRVWDDVVAACDAMRVFDGDAAVEAWCRRAGVAKGDVRPLAAVAAFAGDWYATALDRDWRKRTAAEARALFAQHGFDGPIWDLPESGERF